MLAFHAAPLEKYSSLHSLSVLKLRGIDIKLPLRLKFAFNFNLRTPPQPTPSAQLVFKLRDSDNTTSRERADFSIKNLVRWRFNLARYASFADYLQGLKHRHRRKYQETLKSFSHYGATLSLIEEDWSPYAETVYKLYQQVAEKHGAQLYDLNFFQTIAKISEYKLLCIWYQGSIIGMLVLLDEGSIFHSVVCGLDYLHSKKCHAYSRLHYEFIRLGMEAKKYTDLDVGLTANDAKSQMGFQPVATAMDVYARNRFIKGILRMISWFTDSTLNEEGRLRLRLRFRV